MASEIAIVGLADLEEIGIFEFIRVGAEQIVLVSEHHDINIVVPGDEALVPLGAEDRSAGRVILNSVFLTDLLQLIEKIQFHSPDFLHMLGDYISAALLFLIKRISYFKFHNSPLDKYICRSDGCGMPRHFTAPALSALCRA